MTHERAIAKRRTHRWARRAGGTVLALVLLWGLAHLALRLTGSSSAGPAIAAGPEVFAWRPDPAPAEFGGLSGLTLGPDGTALMAVSDDGALYTAQIQREGTRIADITGLQAWPLSGPDEPALTRFQSDAEAIAPLQDGFAVAFEHYSRIERYDAPGANSARLHPWDRFDRLFHNISFEALADLGGGRLMAVIENREKASRALAYILDPASGDWTGPHALPAGGGFAVTGAALGPDGCLYLSERHFGPLTGFTARVRRLRQEGDALEAETLFTGAPGQLGNTEGIAVWTGPAGGLHLTLVTDNDFPPFTPTRLIEFALDPAHPCTSGPLRPPLARRAGQ